MKVCLAGTAPFEKLIKASTTIPFVLESFYYVKDWQIPLIENEWRFFLLDSGAFTFMTNAKQIEWTSYVDSYADFIVKHNIEHFFELDIDSVIGYEEVKKLRVRLENKTGRRCIPVWHKARGKEEFIKIAEEYDYIAIGGIVSKELKSKDYKYLPWFINEAHKRKCKIHGLGFTGVDNLERYHFDSVDSTSWLSGGRFGQLHQFKDGKMIQIKRPDDTRSKSARYINTHNLNEWIKFQKYAEVNL